MRTSRCTGARAARRTPCHYFQNLENGLDNVHVLFVHRDAPGAESYRDRGMPRIVVNIQDTVARLEQGIVADRQRERLGRSDAAVILLRQVWRRELRALATGQPLWFAIPADAPAVSYYAWGVPKGSAHPATATLPASSRWAFASARQRWRLASRRPRPGGRAALPA